VTSFSDLCRYGVTKVSLVGRVSAGPGPGADAGSGAQGPGAGMRAGSERGAGRSSAPTTGGAGNKYRGLPSRKQMPHTPRTADGAAPGGARPSAPRRPPPPVSTRVATGTLVCDAVNVLAPAHASPRRAARAVSLIVRFDVCESIKATGSRFRHSYRCAPGTTGSPRGRRDSERAASAASPHEAVILRRLEAVHVTARGALRAVFWQC
jgi:hypothetical protein